MIEKPVPGVTTVQRPHPAGSAGALLSLKEVGERAWKARTSPRLRAWAIKAVRDGNAQDGGRRQKMQAVLDAFRKKVPYVADPVMTEFMATPEQTLCLDEGGLCLLGGDCDDQAIALAAASLALGIPAMIVGSSNRSPADVPTHVYNAFEDELGEWIRMDGTTKLPVGRVAPNIREWWVEPGEEAKEKGQGDFVGMADGPGDGDGDGMLDGPVTMLDLLYPGIR